MKTAENRLGDDPVAVTNPTIGRHRREGRSIRHAGSKTCVRTPAIVVRHPLHKDAPHVALVQRITKSEHSRRIVPISRSPNALACGDRTGVLRTVSPIAAMVRSTPSE
jgi:hypothetical protein